MVKSEPSHVPGVPQRRLPAGRDARVFLQQLFHSGQAGPLKSCKDQTQQKVVFSHCHLCVTFVLDTI